MNLYFHLCIVACSIIVYVGINKYIWWTNLHTDPLLFAIGILSARENFSFRDAVRSTWLKEYSMNKSDSIKAWFIVGKDDCNLPPQFRLSEYGCDKLNIKLSGLSSHFYTSYKRNSNDSPSSSKEVFWQGFSFKVNHPLIVRKLGILYNLLIPNTETKVAILDIQSKEIVVQAIISQNTSYLEKGYLYEDVETTLLPKHYEGMVLVEGYLQRDASAHILWNDGGGVITFNRIYSTPSHADSIKYSNRIYPAASIYFVIHNFDDLKTLLSEEERRTSEWLSNLENINRKLLIESNAMQDILFVDVKDTYRNLPNKLLQFYKWLNQNHKYSYVVKSDDDTVVDLGQLISRTKNSSRFKADELWLWSWFRTDWPVNYVGKWADFDYRSSLYPSFPCGATYVMSHKTVQWLSLNADYLFPYQGEDVSMGIWLSAVKPDFVNDQNFECDISCSKSSYNRAQLKPEDIYKVWALYEKCQNLCSCS